MDSAYGLWGGANCVGCHCTALPSLRDKAASSPMPPPDGMDSFDERELKSRHHSEPHRNPHRLSNADQYMFGS